MDVVAADLTVTPSRLEVLDFSIPFMDASLTVLTAVKMIVSYKQDACLNSS